MHRSSRCSFFSTCFVPCSFHCCCSSHSFLLSL